jgi:hypothetical protein
LANYEESTDLTSKLYFARLEKKIIAFRSIPNSPSNGVHMGKNVALKLHLVSRGGGVDSFISKFPRNRILDPNGKMHVGN